MKDDVVPKRLRWEEKTVVVCLLVCIYFVYSAALSWHKRGRCIF